MRILVHDHSGHPFQAELSRELSRRGHAVTHSYVCGYVSGKGRLEQLPGEAVDFVGIGGAKPVANERLLSRLWREVTRGFALVRHVRQVGADVVLVSNVQIPTLVIFAAAMLVMRRPWVLWHQDVYAVAVRSMAGTKLPRRFVLVAIAFEIAERWCARRAAAIVVIAESFVPVHRKWGTASKVVVIENWAPLDEIVPTERNNAWSREHGLDEQVTLLYSGTLGLKHNPALLPALTRAVTDLGVPARLVVVNEGPAVEVVRKEAARLEVPVTLLPFQPYDRLSEVLGSGDVLVVLLEKDAGAFSVPSKTLSYLCAGRPVVGLIPLENRAAEMVVEAGGRALPPDAGAIPGAAGFVAQVVTDPKQWAALGCQAREYAEKSFGLCGVGDAFEALLVQVASGETDIGRIR